MQEHIVIVSGSVPLADHVVERIPEPAILLAHHPDTWRSARKHGADLTVSGHTHAGQIRIGPWISVLSMTRFCRGII